MANVNKLKTFGLRTTSSLFCGDKALLWTTQRGFVAGRSLPSVNPSGWSVGLVAFAIQRRGNARGLNTWARASKWDARD